MFKQLFKTALISFISSFISCSIFFLFLSIFIFNLQIQHHTPDGNMSSFTDIVQVDELASNLHTYFIEDCPFVCIPEKN
jgi:hypothetical protein